MKHTLQILAGCLFFWLGAGAVAAQETVVEGIVRDVNTQREIKAVNVFIKGSKIGTTTNVSGRFRMVIPAGTPHAIVVFRHIAYVVEEIPVDRLQHMAYVDLQPRVIPMKSVAIEEQGAQKLEIQKDLPQPVSIIEARNYEIRGFVDAGDLLRIDHSVQVEEELSGQKTVAIRGGNSDEVVVLFNGVKMNNAFDNVFDLSLIDLEDIERFELIKGSNTALYGPEAFSGVINIVPKTQQDYTIRFQQRFGTYRSGNWGLHLYKKYKNFFGSYSIKRGGFSREFVDVSSGENGLKNSSTHHTGNLNYNLTREDGSTVGTLSGMWIYSTLDYDNRRDAEQLDNSNNLLSLKYSGSVLGVPDVDISTSYKKLDEKQLFNSASVDISREIDDEAFYLTAQKTVKWSNIELLFAYQFQNNTLDFLDRREIPGIVEIGLEGATLERNHHGLVSIFKYHGETESDFLRTVDLDFSVRHDRVRDSERDETFRQGGFTRDPQSAGEFGNNSWNETMVKFSLNTVGYRDDVLFNGYLNFGSNTKFPTLFQQISSPLVLTQAQTQPNLSPEQNKSFEIGMRIARDVRNNSHIYGWQVTGNYFQNHYTNKFRIFTSPRTPVAFYDNVKNARISGFEGTAGVFLFKKKVSVDVGLSKYFISEKAAFPFKSDNKRTLTVNIDHAGYSFQLFWFRESEQSGWLRFQDGSFAQITNPSYTNLDLHLSKTFELFHLKLFANATGRNLLNGDKLVLEGLATRDRRFYLTLGAQY